MQEVDMKKLFSVFVFLLLTIFLTSVQALNLINMKGCRASAGSSVSMVWSEAARSF